MWNFNYDSPKEISQILDLASLAMTKKFGQNFLYSASARERIVRALNAQEDASVWEIGPGLGSITSLLLKSGVKVRAFEIDNGFCRLLKEQAFADEDGFSLVQGDALKTLFTQDETPDYICGNLPYNVGSVCIAKLIENDIRVRRMVFTLQKEVAERMSAKPGDDEYSSFSVLTQLDYDNSVAFTIPRTCFYPAPNVDSAVIVMKRKEKSLVADSDRALFLSMIRALFAQRRKTIRNNLVSSPYFSSKGKEMIENAFIKAGLSGQERAEALSFDTLCSLMEALKV